MVQITFQVKVLWMIRGRIERLCPTAEVTEDMQVENRHPGPQGHILLNNIRTRRYSTPDSINLHHDRRTCSTSRDMNVTYLATDLAYPAAKLDIAPTPLCDRTGITGT